jgi:MFS family permease
MWSIWLQFGAFIGYENKNKPDTIRARICSVQLISNYFMRAKKSLGEPMNAIEKKAVFSLAGIFGLRIFGLFLILPVFALFADELSGATPTLIGVTLGAYGLTQAILQIPFGILSDRWGRKKAILLGLLIFAIGSVVAAYAETIYGVMVGRMIQGAGAISAAVIALLADLTREEQRTKAMALVGVSIGFIFMLSMMLGPLLDNFIGVRGIFGLTAVFALLAMAVLMKVTPNPVQSTLHRDAEPVVSQLKEVMQDSQLRRLDFGIFSLHMVLTAIFVVVPFQLIELGGLEKMIHWKVYVPVMLAAIITMVPFLILSQQTSKIRGVFIAAITLVAIALVILSWSASSQWWPFVVGLVVFFAGFNALEAMLPSLVSRVAPAGSKGTATGVYNSAQFLGVFVGGSVAGFLSGFYGPGMVFLFCLSVIIVWLGWTIAVPAFTLYSSKVINVGSRTDEELSALKIQLLNLAGVQDVSLLSGESTAYLKIDDKQFQQADLNHILKETSA